MIKHNVILNIMAMQYIILDHPAKKSHYVGKYTKDISPSYICSFIEKNIPHSKNIQYNIYNYNRNITLYDKISDIPLSKKFGNVLCLRIEEKEFFDYDNLEISSREKIKESTKYIYISTLTGKKTPIPYAPNLTISELCYLFKEKEGIPIDQMKMIYAGKFLNREDNNTLEEHNIQRDSNLHMILNLRGGMFMEATSGNIDYKNMENVKVDFDFDFDLDF
jgi:hypothetical protein